MTALTLHTVGSDWVGDESTAYPLTVMIAGIARTYRRTGWEPVMGLGVPMVRTTWEEADG